VSLWRFFYDFKISKIDNYVLPISFNFFIFATKSVLKNKALEFLQYDEIMIFGMSHNDDVISVTFFPKYDDAIKSVDEQFYFILCKMCSLAPYHDVIEK